MQEATDHASRSLAACGQWPSTFILGAQKGATSSLCRAMSDAGATLGTTRPCCAQHWHHCIDRDDSLGETHFLSLCGSAAACATKYPLLFQRSSTPRAMALDCTPNHLSDVGAPALLRRIVPISTRDATRFIVSLREPSDRMLSWYNHRRVDIATGIKTWKFCTGPGTWREASGAFTPSFADDVSCELRKWRQQGSMRSWLD
jgi:hypothetical protein